MLSLLLRGMASRVTVVALNFGILLVSSRYLGPASRGEISLFLLNIALVQLIAEIYTGYSLVHFIPRYNFTKLARLGFAAVLLLCPLLWLALHYAGLQVEGYTWTGLVCCLLVVLHTFCCVLLLGREKVRQYHRLCVLQPALLLAGMLVTLFGLRLFTFAAFFWPLLVSFSVALVFSLRAAMRAGTNNETVFSLQPLLIKGLAYQGAIIFLLLANRFNYYLLNDKTELGIYSAATSLMDSCLVWCGAMIPFLLAHTRANAAEAARSAIGFAKISVGLSLLVLFFLFLLPSETFILVLGNGFAPLKKVMLLYGPGMVMLGFFSVLSAWLTACGKPHIVLMAYGAGFLCTLVLAPALVRAHHMAGAALAADISYFLISLLVLGAVIRHSGLRPGSLFSIRGDMATLKNALIKEGTT